VEGIGLATIVGQELKKWKESLSVRELSKYDITVANIILNNYAELQQAGGVAGGRRIMKFAQLVNEKKGECGDELIEISAGNALRGNKIKRICSLEVESFRGFATNRKFELDKQYVLLYGPNGSGKTSFSEALEYGLLGSIEEADADNIKLTTYIKNTSTQKGIAPVVNCLFEDGEKGLAEVDYETYRFAFVEKNRITDFSHISSLNAKNQSERIAALFGLSAFSNFVQGFTKNCDEKYLPTQSVSEQAFKEQKAIRDAKNTELASLQADLDNLQQSAKDIINKLSRENTDIKTLQHAIEYYDDAKTGLLTIKLQEKEKNTSKLVEFELYKVIQNCCKDFLTEISDIILLREELANKALEVNYKELYETISRLEENDICPACGTPIVSTARNPYIYAKKKIHEYDEIDAVKQSIHDHAVSCKTNIDELYSYLENNIELASLLTGEVPTLGKLTKSEIEKMDESVNPWLEFARSIAILSDENVQNSIIAYNTEASKKNEAYSREIEELKNKEKMLISLQTQISEKQKVVTESKSFIDEFDVSSSAILHKIEKEKRQAEYNCKIADAYKRVIDNLYTYAEKLPELIAQDLEERIIDYYNVINKGDADFEMLSNIRLPKGDSSKIMLTFKDGSSSDALQVLSEGHIKILGLSILLAKAVEDGLNFIIFDDIVNAIDDEHRNGVANLLIAHKDFNDVQIILSTHGDQFIVKLKDKLSPPKRNKDLVIYKFLPADSLLERGVIVEYSDARTPIEAARKKYDDNELKDAASKCRQAMESISYNLWNKISNTADGQISVAMRSPKSLPELASIRVALIKKCKTISGMECITQNLEIIGRGDNWRVLNKGTHFEDEQPEFDRVDVKTVLDILAELDTQVRDLDIRATVV
jgi:energy-coupling factor transporter ATP-binding protein EcfA2/cob(I)alamin adenosyltransferase